MKWGYNGNTLGYHASLIKHGREKNKLMEVCTWENPSEMADVPARHV